MEAGNAVELDSECWRELATQLGQLERHDYNEWWELPFLDSMVRRPVGYAYSPRECAKLLELKSYAELHTHYDRCSVESLVRQAYLSRLGLDQEEQDDDVQWIVGLFESRTSILLTRELKRLVAICKRLRILYY